MDGVDFGYGEALGQTVAQDALLHAQNAVESSYEQFVDFPAPRFLPYDVFHRVCHVSFP